MPKGNMTVKEKTNIKSFTDFMIPAIVLVICLALASGVVAQVRADQTNKDLSRLFNQRHQAGIRIGVWSNRGDTPGQNLPSGISTAGEEFNDANFYFEGLLGLRISTALVAELSVGIVNRGEAILQDGNTNYIGNLLVYPILAKLKLYPLSGSTPKLHPYLLLGGGVYHVRHDIQFATGGTASFLPFLEEDSETSLGFVVGGGVDMPLASVIALELNAQYMPIKQSTALIGVDNWSSLTFTIGVKYLYRSKDKKDHRRTGMKR
jgi:opacity protein-like surface antigen